MTLHLEPFPPSHLSIVTVLAFLFLTTTFIRKQVSGGCVRLCWVGVYSEAAEPARDACLGARRRRGATGGKGHRISHPC